MTGKLIVLGLAALALVAFTPPELAAQQASKCSSTKLSAAGKKGSSRAKCYAKAVQKNMTVESGCLSKVDASFGSSFSKAELKGDCLTLSDSAAIETQVDTCIDNIRTAVNNQAAGPSVCDGKKIQAAGKKFASKAKCHAKGVAKGTSADAGCLSTAETKFSSAVGKAETGGDCTNTGQSAALEAVVDTCIASLANALNPPPTTTTATTTTTTTILGHLLFTTVQGTTSCGTAGLSSPPAPPFSGEIDSDTAGTTKIRDLGVGCLYIGGGNGTIIPPGPIPDNETLTFNVVAPGTLGGSPGTAPKNCTLGAGPGHHCVNNNTQAACTSDVNCGGAAGACALDANCFFGPPLEFFSPPPFGALTTCAVNAIQTDGSGTFTQATGDASLGLLLSSRVYITGNTGSPCPKCMAGTCTYGLRAGLGCTSDTTFLTTLDCLPSLAGFQAPLPVNLTPLTSGLSLSAVADGNFCPSQLSAGAFGQATTHAIKQQGSPAGDLSDNLPHPAVLGYNFCIPATNNAAVDGVADLPGPGSVGLTGNAQFTP